MSGLVFIISAPSGTGKTSLIKALLKKKQSHLSLATSHTTRLPRAGEIADKDYYFVSKKEFVNLQEKQQFIETACVFDNYYGTSMQEIDRIISISKNVLLEIDYQGAEQVIKHYNTVTIFILPPSIKTLEKRLQERGKDNADVIKKRLAKAITLSPRTLL